MLSILSPVRSITSTRPVRSLSEAARIVVHVWESTTWCGLKAQRRTGPSAPSMVSS